uniref:dentin sialophosphoprotein n=1 Tax=Euleptes europaea TaxID=460621 RepID=UPI002541B66D|nr:dentin sialophosphoprotein [Euleptes europaea]
MKMNSTVVFLFFLATAWAAPASHNERSSAGDNKDVSNANNVGEHDVVKNNQEYFEHQNARKASGNTSPISEGHSGAKSKESGIKESHASVIPYNGAADFVDANGNRDGKDKTNLSNVETPGSNKNKATNGHGAGGESINGNKEDGVFSFSLSETGGGNAHDTRQTELSRLHQNNQGNKVGDTFNDTAGSHSNQVQILTNTYIGVPERRKPADNTNLKSKGNKVYGESIQWTGMNAGASGNGGNTAEEGSSDGWVDGNSEDTEDLGAHETEKHGDGSRSQADDGKGTTNYSLSTSEEDSSQQHNNISSEKDETVELCHKAKKNEHTGIKKKGNRVLGNNGHKKKGVAGNYGVTDGNLNGERRNILPGTPRKFLGGLTNTNSSQDANEHRSKPRDDSSSTSKGDESIDTYSFSDEIMQGDDPDDIHESEGSENNEKVEEESTSEDASDELSESNDGDRGRQPQSSEAESVRQSASSESQSASDYTKSDSGSDSESKTASSESKSDSSSNSDGKLDSSGSKSDSSSESEGKSDSSSEGKSDSSGSKSDSSEGKSDSSEGKSDSSSESKPDSSEGKSESSSESKSDSSSEGKSDSSSESKSDSSESKSDSSIESKSDSSEGKSDSSDSKSDSANESESNSDSSEGKSDSSTKGNSSDESESRESSRQAASSENGSQSGTGNGASDESKSNDSESQSANHSDSGMASVSDESDGDGGDMADTTENTSDSESAEDEDRESDPPMGHGDSESESISEGSESTDSTSDY